MNNITSMFAFRKGLTVLLLVCSWQAMAQDGGKWLQRGDQNFERLAFSEAIEDYKKSILYEDDPAAIVSLADCYRLIDDPVGAETWYAKALTVFEDDELSMLYYARALQQNGKYAKAIDWYRKYRDLVPDDKLGDLGIIACKRQDYFKKRPPLFKGKNVGDLNSPTQDFGAAYYQDGIVFTSDRKTYDQAPDQWDWYGQPFYDIFIANQRNQSGFGTPKRIQGVDINSRLNDGPVCFTPDYRQMFYTRNQFDPNAFGGVPLRSEDGLILQEIVTTWYDEAKKRWGPSQVLPFNFTEYSTMQPAISPDGGTLYFASDMFGGHGGTDLWKVSFESGFWGVPQNLGPGVNTAGDEMFPFIAADSTLYFASNAHPGMGGFDVFRATWNEQSGQYDNVWNMGVPVNSSRDDYSFILDEYNASGYFSSNRPGGKGQDDIYSLTAIACYLDVAIVDMGTGRPMSGVTVKLLNRKGELIAKDTSDHLGRFLYVVDPEERFHIEFGKRNYALAEMDFNTKGLKPGDTKSLKIHMKSILDIRVAGVVKHTPTGYPIMNALVKLENKLTGRVDSMRVGYDAKFEFRLYPGTDYLLSGYYDGNYDEHEITTDDIHTNKVIAKDLVIEGDTPHVLFRVHHVYFDFGKADIRDDAIEGLQTLYDYLQNSPFLRVEVGAHTDCRGGSRANEILSQKRAVAVRDWLVASGIKASRLTAKGYGEYQLLNGCSDGKVCSEDEHQRNRRVELRLIDRNNKVVFISRDIYVKEEGKEEWIEEDLPADVNYEYNDWKDVPIVNPSR